MAENVRTVHSQSELENMISIYNSNGFKVKKESETEVKLVKKTRKKSWSLTGGALGFVMIIPCLVLLCCTIFTWPFIYNRLHTKVEKVTIRIV